MNLNEVFEIRANKADVTKLSKDNNKEYFNKFSDYIKDNSELLNQCIIVEGNIASRYYFDIENTIVYEGELNPDIKYVNDFNCTPKLLCAEFSLNISNKFNYMFSEIDEKSEFKNMRKLLFKPFMQAVEKNIISGDYFDKSIFNSSETITATNDFNGLLKLIRALKEKNEKNCIVVNPSVMEKITDTITKEAYLNEYLLNKTIEGVKIIENLNAPKNKITGFNPTQIYLLLVPNIQIRKFREANINNLDSIYQIFSFANGGDIFNTAISFNI
jgi:hypothetical protein